MPHYFTSDGAYGSAGDDEFVVLNTTHWQEDDWVEVESASDSDRLETAKVIDWRYRNGIVS
jgi:hypothetical protein